LKKEKEKEKKISLKTSELLQVMFVKRTDPIGGWTHLIPKKFFLKLISTFLFFTSNQSLFITIQIKNYYKIKFWGNFRKPPNLPAFYTRNP
jgi:hypothetical protein